MGKRKRSATDDPGVRGETAAKSEAAEKDALLSNKSLFVEELSRDDHDREQRLYKLLGSYILEERIQAADVIVEALLGSSDDATGVPEVVLLRHLERRLLRGLASGNRAARIGNCYVLTELFQRLFVSSSRLEEARYPGLTFNRLLDILLEKTKPGTNVPGQEERDHYWGQLFGLQCFVESGALFPGGIGRDNSRWNRVLGCLLDLGHKKVWLRPFACYVIVQAIIQGNLPSEQAVAATLKTIAADNSGGASLAKTQEGLGIWLAALSRYPDMILPAPWTSPLTAGTYKDLVAVLRSSGGGEEASEAAKQGNASVQLHFVWDLLLTEIMRRYPPGTSAKQFDTFWGTVVDQPFFAKASDHQKITGFNVFQKALALCADKGSVYPSLFSNNFMVCLMNNSWNGTNKLHMYAVQVLKTIEKQVEDHPDILTQVLASLLGTAQRSRGVYDFDDRVKGTGDSSTRPVERILRFADGDNIDAVIEILQAGALVTKDVKNDQKAFRTYADYLFRLASYASAPVTSNPEKQGKSVGGVAFDALARLAYSTTQQKNKNNGNDTALSPFPKFNTKTITASRKLLLSAAGSLLKRPDNFTDFCRTILAISPAEIEAVGSNGEIMGQVTDARKLLKHLLHKSKKSKVEEAFSPASARASQGLAVLLAVSLLQLYNDPRPDALEVLQDIKACSEKLDALKDGADVADTENMDVDDEDDEQQEPDVGEVLTEVLLAMLAESSPLARQTSLQVFEAFTPLMSAKALDSLTDVLAAEENTAGYRALFSNEDEDEDDDDEDDDDIEMDSDVELIDGETAEEEGSSSDDEEEEEDDESEEESDDEEDLDDEDDEEEDGEEEDEDEEGSDKTTPDKKKAGKAKPTKESESDRFEAALRETFKMPQGKEEEDADDSDHGSDMSDDAMLALDSALAGHLKLIRDKTDSHKKERADARRKVVEFKHRVLDLIHAYIRAVDIVPAQAISDPYAHPAILVFRVLRPLVELVRDTSEAPLSKKALRTVKEARRTLRKARESIKATGGKSIATLDADAAVAALRAIHDTVAHKNAERHAFAQTLSTTSLTIASTMLAACPDPQATIARVAGVYDETQLRAETEGWTLRAVMRADWENWRKLAEQGGAGNGE